MPPKSIKIILIGLVMQIFAIKPKSNGIKKQRIDLDWTDRVDKNIKILEKK